MSSEDSSDDGESRCPFCRGTENCDHILLVVDKTFRTAEGGILMHAFNARWSAVFDDAEVEVEEREAFDELLYEVRSLSDAMSSGDNDGAPGMSSAYATYFSRSKEKANAALASFGRGYE